MKAYLILEDGSVFEGTSFGAQKEVISEIVFNTSMTGYLEVFTDPSYAGQSVVMTYPLIGNYGVAYEDVESDKCQVDAVICREIAETPSNFRSTSTIEAFLKKNDIPGIKGIDTRALTKKLREKGTMNGFITTDNSVISDSFDISGIISKLKSYKVTGVVNKVTCSDKLFYPASTENTLNKKFKVAVIDFGSKKNIVRCLLKRGCDVTVYPAYTSAAEILSDNPDGIMLSNGPGDPAECTDIIREVKNLYDSNVPVFAICLGHQLMALATGCRTEKMKWGHRGANHPVKDLKTGRVYMSSQNHGYVVIEDSINPEIAVPGFKNANDGTIEGLRYVNKNVFTVQFHPEACAGPQDTEFLFDEFIKMMEVVR